MTVKLKTYYNYLFCILIFFLPLEGEFRIVPNILLIILGLFFILSVKKSDLKIHKHLVFLSFLGFLMYLIANLFVNGNLADNFFIIKKLLIVIAIYILYMPLNIDKKIKFSFILGTLLSIGISIVSIILYVLDSGEFSFSVGDIVGEVLLTERVYLAFVAVISFVFSLDLMNKTTKKIRLLLIINIIIIVAFILLISARMALISILLISLYNLIFLKKFKLLFIGFVSASFVLILFFSLNDNLQNRFFYKDKESTFVENFKKWEPRVEIWQCVSALYRENSINQKAFGYGSFKKTKDKLLNCYSESIYDLTKKNWFLKIKYNTHNQFFDFLLSVGVVGVILFLIPFLVLVYTNRSNRINISLVIAFLMVCFVENCFHRQLGVYLFGLIIIMVSTDLKATNMNYNING